MSHWEGAIHMLTVTTVGEPEGTIIPLRPLTYTIAHPATCIQAEETDTDGASYLDWTCDVGQHLNDGEIEFALHYSGTPVTEPGHYLIRAWGSQDYVHDYGTYEYDGSLIVVADPYPLTLNLAGAVPAGS